MTILRSHCPPWGSNDLPRRCQLQSPRQLSSKQKALKELNDRAITVVAFGERRACRIPYKLYGKNLAMTSVQSCGNMMMAEGRGAG